MNPESFIAFIFISLLLITIFKEFKFLNWMERKFPFFIHLIPNWSFFAPVPYKTDYFILYRYFDQKETPTKWKKAYDLKSHRSWHCFLWNPDKTLLKSSVDIVVDLLKFVHLNKETQQIVLSLPYLHLLNYVIHLENKDIGEKIQFVILSQSKHYQPELVLLSEVHPLNKEP